MKLFAPIFLLCGFVLFSCNSDSSVLGKKTKKVTAISNSKITFEGGSTIDLDPAKSTIFLVPNAEYIKSETEPIETVGLTSEGSARAARLAQMMSEVELGAVLSSSQVRSALTVQPTSNAKKLGTLNYSSNTRHRIFEFIYDYNPGKKFLLVGENNSIPLIISDLTGFEIGPNLPEDTHDIFYVITGTAPGSCNVEEYSY